MSEPYDLDIDALIDEQDEIREEYEEIFGSHDDFGANDEEVPDFVLTAGDDDAEDVLKPIIESSTLRPVETTKSLSTVVPKTTSSVIESLNYTKSIKAYKTPGELALMLQAMRERDLGTDSLGTATSSSAAANALNAAASSRSASRAASHHAAAASLLEMVTVYDSTVKKLSISTTELSSFLLPLPPKEGDYTTCVLSDGRRMFLKKNPVVSNQPSDFGGQMHGNQDTSHGGVGLLSKPMTMLMKEAEQMRKISVAARAAAIQSGVNVKETAAEDALVALAAAAGVSEGSHSVTAAAPSSDLAPRSSSPASSSSISINNSSTSVVAGSGGGSLWVEKYTPKSFAQLLSPENINREVLRALKAWDRYIFKKRGLAPKPDLKGGIYGNSKYGSTQKPGTAGDTIHKHNATGNELLPDHDGESFSALIEKDNIASGVAGSHDTRPDVKVILLSGPPGTGKSTLAHIIASHCGYRPLEVNASDDRSVDRLRDIMSQAMSSNTIFGEKRPNCIILDEIDGIDSTASIELLTSIIKAPLKAKAVATLQGTQKGTEGSRPSGKRSSSAVSSSSLALTRPLICICNDHFAPALRDLKKVAHLVVFPPPLEMRLVQRLKHICAAENVRVSPTVLADLCHATGNDIRSSLNTLQFTSLRADTSDTASAATSSKASNKKGAQPQARAVVKDISYVLSRMLSSGLKDDHKNVFQIWREVFSIQEMARAMAKKKNKFLFQLDGSSNSNNNNNTSEMRFSSPTESDKKVWSPVEEIMHETLDHGDIQLVMTGLFENFLNVRYHDPDFTKTLVASDWLSHCDLIDNFTRVSPGGFQVSTYISTCAGAIHTFCASDHKVKIEWPNKDKNAFYARSQKDNLLGSFIEGAMKCRSLTSKKSMVEDVVSYLIDILTPRVRPLPFPALSPSEKLAINDVVHCMAQCGLSYRPAAGAGTGIGASFGRSQFRGAGSSSGGLVLEPDITQLIDYLPLSTSSRGAYFSLTGGGGGAGDSDGALSQDLRRRHFFLDPEVAQTIASELRTYLITHKESLATDTDAFEIASERKTSSSSSYATFFGSSAGASSVAAKGTTPQLFSTTKKIVSDELVVAGSTTSLDSSAALAMVLEADPSTVDGPDGDTDHTNKRARLTHMDATTTTTSSDESTITVSKKPVSSGSNFFATGSSKRTASDALFLLSNASRPRTHGAASDPNNISGLSGNKATNKIHFKFNQGFSDAVRRQVTIRDFF